MTFRPLPPLPPSPRAVQLGIYLLSAGILVTQNYTFGVYVVAHVTLTHIYATGSCNNELTTEP